MDNFSPPGRHDQNKSVHGQRERMTIGSNSDPAGSEFSDWRVKQNLPISSGYTPIICFQIICAHARPLLKGCAALQAVLRHSHQQQRPLPLPCVPLMEVQVKCSLPPFGPLLCVGADSTNKLIVKIRPANTLQNCLNTVKHR